MVDSEEVGDWCSPEEGSDSFSSSPSCCTVPVLHVRVCGGSVIAASIVNDAQIEVGARNLIESQNGGDVVGLDLQCPRRRVEGSTVRSPTEPSRGQKNRDCKAQAPSTLTKTCGLLQVIKGMVIFVNSSIWILFFKYACY